VTVIDMSHYQNDAGAIDWNRVRPGLAGLYLKITEGSDYADPAWARNYASSVNIPRGAYHFCGNSVTNRYGDPTAEANHFADVYLSKTWELRPAYDIEMVGADPRWLAAFRDQFRRRTGITGDRVYTSQHLITGALRPELWMGGLDTDLWIARYNSTLGFAHPKLVLWQYTSAGSWPGIPGRVDLNREMNNWHPGYDSPATAAAGLAALYEEDGYMPIQVSKGGAKNAPKNVPIALSMLREHDIIIAPGDLPVVLYASYHWGWDTGTGGNPCTWDPQRPDAGGERIIPVKGSFSWIVPRGTGKADVLVWSDDDFSLTVAPR
jgi:GH25 family lysozyme M1 (1,4-beta-N-acetylmuramidase)